jgi:putative integral membrane protein (TIGR02587 family)
MPEEEAQDERGPWAREAVELVRGTAGGMLFGIPLIYTMEVWWAGTYAHPTRMIAVLATTFFIVLLLMRTTGFRETKDVRWRDAAMDTVEAVALGIVCVAAVLFLLRELTAQTPLQEALGKIVYEATPFSIGVAVAYTVLRRGRAAKEDDDREDDGEEEDTGVNATVADIGATAVGALFIAFNIAPTDEIPMIASAMAPVWQLALIVASLLISYGIVFGAGFANQEQRHQQQGVLQHPFTETIVSYLVALVAAAGMLWFFQRFDLAAPWEMTLSHVIVLGLPAAVGGAAGRLAV